MAENGNTAEHELLKMIEGQENVDLENKSDIKPSHIDATKDQMSEAFSRILEKISFDKIKEMFHVALINKILVAAICFFVIIYVFVGFRGINRLNNIPTFDLSKMKKVSGQIRAIKPPLKDYAYYMDILLGRNIFKEKAENEKVETEHVESVQDFIKDLRLVGISWAENESDRYAMVEDLKTEITHYVQVNDDVSSFTVEEIFEKKIVLKYGDQKIDLR